VQNVLALIVVVVRSLQIVGTPARTATKQHAKVVTQADPRNLATRQVFEINNFIIILCFILLISLVTKYYYCLTRFASVHFTLIQANHQFSKIITADFACTSEHRLI
jgi:hypothetical protein